MHKIRQAQLTEQPPVIEINNLHKAMALSGGAQRGVGPKAPPGGMSFADRVVGLLVNSTLLRLL